MTSLEACSQIKTSLTTNTEKHNIQFQYFIKITTDDKRLLMSDLPITESSPPATAICSTIMVKCVAITSGNTILIAMH
jgi:hypothetical protein